MNDDIFDFDDDLWLDDIEEGEWKPFAPGVYQFTVKDLEKGVYQPKPGSNGKTPACKQAIYVCEFTDGKGNKSTCRYRIALAKVQEWKIKKFMHCCGIERDESSKKIHIVFDAPIGKTGWARLSLTDDKKWNNIEDLILPKDAPKEATKSEPEDVTDDDEELPF